MTSVITFVLNSALLSSFIIPQVQKLKEIKDQIFQFGLPKPLRAGAITVEEIARLGQPDQQVQALQSILDMYRIRSGELRATVSKFYLSIAVATLTLAAAQIRPNLRDGLLTVHPILQLLILWWAVETYSVGPDQLSSPLYLVRDCDINPHLLISAIEMKLSFGRSDLGRAQTWEDSLSIDLWIKLRLVGFRFLFILADAEGKIFYVSYGPVTGRTRIWRYLLEPMAGIPEMNRIELGRFKFNQFVEEKQLRGILLIFLPIYNEKLHPMLLETSIHVPGRNKGTMLANSGGSGPAVSSDTVYARAWYRGEGSNISDIEIENDVRGGDPVIDRIIKKFKNDFLWTDKIEEIEDINGLIA